MAILDIAILTGIACEPNRRCDGWQRLMTKLYFIGQMTDTDFQYFPLYGGLLYSQEVYTRLTRLVYSGEIARTEGICHRERGPRPFDAELDSSYTTGCLVLDSPLYAAFAQLNALPIANRKNINLLSLASVLHWRYTKEDQLTRSGLRYGIRGQGWQYTHNEITQVCDFLSHLGLITETETAEQEQHKNRLYRQAYRARNLRRCSELARKRYNVHKEVMAERLKQWRKDNPERTRELGRRSGARTQARRKKREYLEEKGLTLW